ncbi:MAG: EamA family transporter [Chloroflexota bacterium]
MDQSPKPSLRQERQERLARPVHPAADPRSVALGMLVLYLVWGSTYLAISVAVDTIPPFLMAGARFLLAGAALLAWTVVRGGRDFVPPTRREWRDSAIVGALLLGGGMGSVAWGEQTIPSGIAALLVALMPVWVAVFGGIFLGERLPRMAVAGIIVGFIGVAILVGPTALGSAGALDPAGVVALIISPIAWSIGSLFASHRAVLPRRPLVNTGAQMVTGGGVLMVMALVSGEFGRFTPAAISGESLAAFAYLAIIGSLLAFTAYGWLLRVAPLPLIATYAYVNPVVAVILGSIILREAIEVRTLVAGAVIVAAVALIVTARSRMAGPRDARRAVSAPPPPSARPVGPAPSSSASD